MKQAFLKIAVAALLAATTMTGCVGVNFDIANKETVRGTGSMIEKEYDAPGYTGVRIEGNFVVEYSSALSDKIVVKIQESLAPYITVKMVDDLLVVESDKHFTTGQNQAPTLYLSTPSLQFMDVQGAVSMDTADTIQAEKFRLNIGGACSMELPLEVKELEVSVAGASNMVLSGTADNARFRIAGASSFEALELQTKNTSVDIAGMGSGSISCSDTLNVEIAGMGNLDYRGDPKVHQVNAGMGSVNRVR